METNKIYNMDAIELLKSFPNSKRIVIITDPPYGINYIPTWRKWDGSECDFEKIEGDDKPFNPEHLLNYNLICFGANYFSDKLPVGNWIIWDKRITEKKDKMIGNPFEMCWYKVNGFKGERIYRILHGGVINADSSKGNNQKRLHPTQKPVKLMLEIIKEFTKEGDLIIDPYCGSGSTLVACARLRREFIGCDINPEYCKIANERIQKELSQTKLNSGNDGIPPKPKVLGILPNFI